VVYLLGEGFGYFPRRIDAWRARFDRREVLEPWYPPGLTLIPGSADLRDPEAGHRMVEMLKRLNPVLVVFETLHRHGMPETDEGEVGTGIANLDRVREGLGCTVLGLVHTPKDGRETPRGHGSLDAAVDTVFHVGLELAKEHEADRSPVGGLLTVRTEQRDLAPEMFYAKVEEQEVKNGRSSLVLREASAAELEAERDRKKAEKAEARTEKRQSTIEGKILDAIRAGNITSKRMLLSKVSARRETVLEVLDQMVSSGRVEVKEGAYCERF
jgi:hypothetical protein